MLGVVLGASEQQKEKQWETHWVLFLNGGEDLGVFKFVC